MLRVPVTSSNVASVGYDSESSILEVEYRSGRVYRFTASPEQYQALLQAPSIGRFLSGLGTGTEVF